LAIEETNKIEDPLHRIGLLAEIVGVGNALIVTTKGVLTNEPHVPVSVRAKNVYVPAAAGDGSSEVPIALIEFVVPN
jgi:hypothetical protein